MRCAKNSIGYVVVITCGVSLLRDSLVVAEAGVCAIEFAAVFGAEAETGTADDAAGALPAGDVGCDGAGPHDAATLNAHNVANTNPALRRYFRHPARRTRISEH
jgi:hypothetical protein